MSLPAFLVGGVGLVVVRSLPFGIDLHASGMAVMPYRKMWTPSPARQALQTNQFANEMGIGVGGARSGSQSTQSSQSGLDYGAKSLLDRQAQMGIDYAGTLQAAVDDRFNDRVSSLNQGYDTTLAQLRQLGGYDRARINREAESRSNSVGAQLAGTGLYNSTVMPTLRQGVERDRLEAQGQLDESLRQQSIATLLQKVQAVDSARADQITANSDIGKVIAELYARMSSNTPNKSVQTSQSQSLSV